MTEIEKSKKLSELSKKLEIAENKVEQYKKYLELYEWKRSSNCKFKYC